MPSKEMGRNSVPSASEAIRQHNLRIQRQNAAQMGHQNGQSENAPNNHNLVVSFAGIDARRHSAAPSSRVHPSNGGTIPQNANWSSPSLASPCPSSTSTADSERQLQKGAHRREESKKAFFAQCCFPFLLAGCGMIAAGILLDKASTWLFLSNVPEALILVPALLGLKGNLEMTLASRLSTMVNLGQMDSPKQQLTALYSNVSLVQAQAIVVSLIASLLAVGTHLAEGNQFDFPRSFCVVLSSMMTASVASFALASIMVLLAIASHRCGLNPDNIATPIAAALGDVISLAFLIIFGTLFYRVRQSALPILVPLCIALLGSTIFWIFLAARVRLTRDVLKFGWFSVLAAMCISSAGGYVLRRAILHFPGIGLFQPVINGVGGNLVAVQASKISTNLHKFGKLGQLPANRLLTYLNPIRTFSCQERESQNALILLAMSFPGHILFISLLFFTGQMSVQALNVQFMVIYICAAVLQVAILLYLCQLLSRLLWLFRFDPDNNSIPLLTAMGDLFGTSLLAFAFFLHVRLFPEFAKMDSEIMEGTTPAFVQALLRMGAREEKWEWGGTTTTTMMMPSNMTLDGIGKTS